MKVLLVEDDVIQRMMLADLLRRFEKVDIVEAADGDAAWQELENGLCPVLCCCDMRMPGMSGIDLLHRFKSRAVLADVPFVFITAATDRETVEEAISSGATNYILKPLNLAKARSNLERIFRSVRERYSEEPAITQRRLGVAPERLLDYYEAFRQQVAEAHAGVNAPAPESESAAGNKLESLKTGCVTLGLWHAALTIECAESLEKSLLDRALADVDAIIGEQVARARLDLGIRAPRKLKAVESPVEEAAGVADAA